SLRGGGGRGRDRPRGGPGGRGGPGPARGREAQLAIPPRPPHRRLRRPRPAVHRLKAAPPTGGFRLPAEWEAHEATWIGWPHRLSDWPRKFAPIPWVYAEI